MTTRGGIDGRDTDILEQPTNPTTQRETSGYCRKGRGVLDAAIEIANALDLPVIVHFGPMPFYPNSNRRHYAFMLDGVPDIAAQVESRKVTFVFRPYPNHRIVEFAREVRPPWSSVTRTPFTNPNDGEGLSRTVLVSRFSR